MIINPDSKNGSNGIRRRTNAPKLEVEMATENAKNMANIKQNNIKGVENNFFTAVSGFLNKTKIVSPSIIRFSMPDKTITTFFASHKRGLNNPVTVAMGNL